MIEDIKRLLVGNLHWSVQFTYRKANNTVHLLTKLAFNYNSETVWLDEDPLQIMNSMLKEKYYLIIFF